MNEFNSQSSLMGKRKETNLGDTKVKDRFELAEDKLLDYFIDKSELLNDPSKNQLVPPAQRRAKLKKELKEAAKELDLNIDLAPALHILRKEGSNYLDLAIYEEMIAQLDMMPNYLEQLDFSLPPKEKLYSSLHINEPTLQAISKIGIAKYDEGKFDSSVCLFALLSTFDNENEDYFNRLGVAAAQMEKWDQALKAFTFALYLNPDLLGARVFSAECYMRLGKKNEAKEEIKKAKRLIEINKPEPIWLEVISSFEEMTK